MATAQKKPRKETSRTMSTNVHAGLLTASEKKNRSVCSVVSDSLRPCGLWPIRLSCPGDSPGKNTEVGCHALLQGNLPDSGIETTSLASASEFFTN